MAENRDKSKGLNILCFDGGGVRGLSSLLLLSEIMNRLAGLEDSQKSLKPADYFDVIAGTGTGGIIACMVGRLGMSVGEAIEAYIKLAKNAFSRKYIGTSEPTAFKGTKLQEALKSMVRDATGDADEHIRNDKSKEKGCKTVIFAMSKHNVTAAIPVLFRSYSTIINESLDCTIWEALYATMAHPDLFKAIEIKDGAINQVVVGGELGCSNPMAHVLAEVRDLYPDRHVSSITSIGAGHAQKIQVPDSSLSQRILRTSTQAVDAVKKMATDSEKVAEEMALRFRGTAQVYYRLNVDQGMQAVEDDWEQHSEVKAHTSTYMKKVETNRILNEATIAIKQKTNALHVKHIDGTIQISRAEQAVVIKGCPAPNPIYTGREDLIEQVGNCIKGNSNERRICVVYGMGGAGKTQLALKTIEQNRDTWKHVVYVDASSKKAIEGALADFAKAQGFGKAYNNALSWLEMCPQPWLLVFDNADHPSLDLHTYFPSGYRGSILITTRLPALRSRARGPGSICRVSEMSQNDGLALFLKVAGIQPQEVNEGEMDAARALLEDFGYLALAIVQAGAYIAYALGLSIFQYRELFLERRQQILEQYSGLEARIKLDDYERSVYTTFNLCYDLLQENGDARPTLWLIAHLQHDDVRQEIFRRAAINICSYKPKLKQTETETEALHYMRNYLCRFLGPNGEWDITRFLNTMGDLASYSLIEFDRVNQAYRVHVLVQDWARAVNPQPLDLAQGCVTLLLSRSVDYLETAESLSYTRSLRRHLEKLLSERDGQVSIGDTAEFAWVYAESGNYDQAEPLRARLLEAEKQELGEEDPNTLESMNDLAFTYQYQGRLKEAESLYSRTLNSRKRVLGEEHPDTLWSMYNLASTYQSLGQYAEAESLQEDTMLARRRVLGAENPDTLWSMADLAWTYHLQGRLEMAVTFHKQVLDARKRLLGEDHPHTLESMNNLAATYHEQGEVAKAELQHTQVLVARKRVLGEEHPETLESMNNLAIAYEQLGRLAEAQSLHEKTLDVSKRVLGENHPETLRSMNNLANTYEEQGRWDEAEPLHEYVVTTRKRVLGEEHPHTLWSMHDLAFTYEEQGRLDEAQSLLEQTLNGFKRSLGEEHRDTLQSMHNLAFMYQDRREWGKAKSLYDQVVEARGRTLGEDHPDTLYSMINLSSTCFQLGLLDEAERLAKAIDARNQIAGEQHPAVVRAKKQLAWIQSNKIVPHARACLTQWLCRPLFSLSLLSILVLLVSLLR